MGSVPSPIAASAASAAAASAVVIVSLAASCAGAPQKPPPPTAPVSAALDASYDWHGLEVLPFGSTLKAAPFTLHEVLMFRDAAHAAQADDAECYAVEQPAPRFLARTPVEYLLCFRHDRLARVEATVNLPEAEAAQIFDDACVLWQKTGSTLQTGSAQTNPEQPGDAQANGAAQAPRVCDGRDGAVAYSSRLEEMSGQGDRALTMRLDALTQP